MKVLKNHLYVFIGTIFITNRLSFTKWFILFIHLSTLTRNQIQNINVHVDLSKPDAKPNTKLDAKTNWKTDA